jgi:hypothetical protein
LPILGRVLDLGGKRSVFKKNHLFINDFYLQKQTLFRKKVTRL